MFVLGWLALGVGQGMCLLWLLDKLGWLNPTTTFLSGAAGIMLGLLTTLGVLEVWMRRSDREEGAHAQND